jgi:hypothetical protein
MPYILKANEKNVTDAGAKDSRKVNDVLAVYHTLPKLTPREENYWTVIEISEQEYEEYKAVRNKVKTYHKAETTEWTEKPPEMKEGWTDEKGSVYELKERPWKIVSHDEKGFSLNVDPAKNKETILIAAKGKEDTK